MKKEITKSVIINGIEYIPKEKKEEGKNEYIFIVDASGSIPIKQHMQTLEQVLSGLQSDNKFNIILFPSIISKFIIVFKKPVILSKKKITEAIHLMNIAYIGKSKRGSELLPAIQKANGLSINKDYKRICIIITDGFIGELIHSQNTEV